MAEEKKDEKRSYTFTDKRGMNRDEPTQQQRPEEHFARSPEREQVHGHLPKIDFATLIMSFASASMIAMGRIPDPATGEVVRNLDVAQQNIDIIILLREKTTGNLSREESEMLDHILYELRMNFVEAAKERK